MEEGVLAEKAHVQAKRIDRRDADDEVPVRGMWRDDRHHLRPVRELALDAPSAEREARMPQRAREGVAPARHAGRQLGNAPHRPPAKPSWRQASNTATATALERLRLRFPGRMGSLMRMSG